MTCTGRHSIPTAIRERGNSLANLALKIWADVGRNTTTNESEKPIVLYPVKILFRECQHPVVNWKDAYVTLLKLFDAAGPGILLHIATEQTLYAAIDLNGNRFRRSKVQLGDVFINTHASASQLKIWCRKIAKIASIGAQEFEFVMSDDAGVTRHPHG